MVDLQNIFNQAVAYHQTGRIPEAINLYLRILPMQRENDELLFTIGTAFCQIGQLEEGLSYLRKSSRINPRNCHTFGNIGKLLTDLRRFDEAVINYNKALTLNPKFPEALLGRGNALVEMQRYQEAVQDYDSILSLLPDFPLAHCNKGKALYELSQFEPALICYGKALELAPEFSEAYNNRGNVYKDIGNYELSLADYNKAIELNLNLEGAYSNRGCVLEKLSRYDEALADHNQAISLKPDYAEAYNNRGNVLKELKRYDEALSDYNQAISLKPDYAEAYSNRGNVLQELKRFDEAFADFDKAIAIKPDYAEAYWNKSLSLILTGQYTEGWKLYEKRFEIEETRNDYYTFPKPKWHSQDDAKNKRVFISSEQGLGDFIQFCRYLPLIKQLGATLVVEVPSGLVGLVSTLDCEMDLISGGSDIPEFDAYCSIMSLPHIFKTTLDTIPAKVPYLFADQAKVREWRGRLGPSNFLRVGLVWSGSSEHKNDKNRSVRLETLEKLLEMPIEWHSLQKEYRGYDLEKLEQHTVIHQHQDDLQDFTDTAALIECMDLVISVDTSIAHVAGAVGKPVWILLPYAPDFRWMLDRDDSPWYPTAKLFRQTKLNDWQSVVGKVQDSLANFIEIKRIGD